MLSTQGFIITSDTTTINLRSHSEPLRCFGTQH